jgi:hypothetical protein
MPDYRGSKNPTFFGNAFLTVNPGTFVPLYLGGASKGSRMSILARLFARRRKPTGCAILVGDGQFQIYVASTPQQRIELELLCGGRNQGFRRMPALLVPQPTSTRGDDSVTVRIGNETVGYLHHTTALEFLAALRPSKFDRAACAAEIVVRPDPQVGETFRVRLDAVVPFQLVDLPTQDAI